MLSRCSGALILEFILRSSINLGRQSSTAAAVASAEHRRSMSFMSSWRGGWFGCIFVFLGEKESYRSQGLKLSELKWKYCRGDLVNNKCWDRNNKRKNRKIRKSFIPKNSYASIPYSEKSANWILNFERSAKLTLYSKISRAWMAGINQKIP